MEDYFHKNLRFLRKSKGLNQQDIADKVNINKNTISDYENQKISPGLNNLKEIAKLFGVRPGDMIDKDLSVPENSEDSNFEYRVNRLVDECDKRLEEKEEVIRSLEKIVDLLEDKVKYQEEKIKDLKKGK